jgi:antitoxin component of MazEF toxin-antitoxin module
MLAKMTSKNQLTLPKALVLQVGATENFDVEARNGQLVLTPVRIQRGDAVRAKLAELNLTEADIAASGSLLSHTLRDQWQLPLLCCRRV